MVFLVAPQSFEQLMLDPAVRQLASAGGAGLMSPRTVPGDAGGGAYVTLGAGTRSSSPFRNGTLAVTTAGSGTVVGAAKVTADNAGRSSPGLLGSELAGHGSVTLDLVHVAWTTSNTFPSDGALMAMDRNGYISHVELGATPVPAASGLTIFDLTGGSGDQGLDPSIAEALSSATSSQVMVMVLAAQTSAQMNLAKDELTPIVIAQGVPSALLPARVDFTHTLTSDTTRRVGVVSNEDIMPTILSYLRVPIPSEVTGTPIRVVPGDAPFAMHARHLETRRMWVPIQTVGAIWLAIAGLFGFFVILRPVKSPRTRKVAAWMVLTPIPLTASMFAAGHLPHPSYLASGGFIVLITAALPALAMWIFRSRGRHPDRVWPPAAMGAVVLCFFVFEAATHWTGALYTLFGGTELDGARWFGLPNALEGVLLGSAVYLAAKLPRAAGVALLAAAGLFAGWPTIGADLGGAMEILFAAGLWLWITSERRWTLRAIAPAAAIPMVGLAAVLVANRYLSPIPTHVTRFVEGGGTSGGLLEEAFHRLSIGWQLLLHNPFAFIPVLIGPLCLFLLWKPPAQMRAGFSRLPVWREAMVVLVAASIVAYFVNDTGVAAMGMGIGSALAGMLYVAIVAGSENIES
jgi:hypothetical protein